MIDIGITIDGADVIAKELKGYEEQIPFATAVALTKTAKAVEADIRKVMPRVFDRPTRFTLSGTFTNPATKKNLNAFVGLKDWAPKGGNARDYLQPHVYSGPRTPKRSEKALRQRGFLKSSEFLVPGRDARLNKHGNITKAQVVKAMSNIGAQRDSAQNSRRDSGRKYFWLPGAGIFFRQGGRLKSFLVIAKQPQYRKRFDFFGLSKASAAHHLPIEAFKAAKFARDTAR